MSTLSIQQAAKLTGVGQDRLRDMMRDGTLKGVISPGGKRFRPSIYSLFVDYYVSSLTGAEKE
jgi:excisionase family DNA binding protein